MIALVQRVRQARVEVAGEVIGAIQQGLLTLVCAEPADTPETTSRLLDKLLKLRIFADAAGKMNLSLADVKGGLLLVSQFTLAADTTRGNRPSFTAAAAPELGRADHPRPRARALRILLVEDHGDTARIMRRLLMCDGHEVQTAADVATALRISSEGGFDLLLSDLGLPDGSGLELMRTLRQQGLTLPGIAVSGYGQEQDVAQSRAAGFAAHLTKPVDLVQLEDAIAAASV